MGYGANAATLRHPITQAAINHDCHYVNLEEAQAYFGFWGDATGFVQAILGMGYTHVMVYDDGLQFVIHWEV